MIKNYNVIAYEPDSARPKIAEDIISGLQSKINPSATIALRNTVLRHTEKDVNQYAPWELVEKAKELRIPASPEHPFIVNVKNRSPVSRTLNEFIENYQKVGREGVHVVVFNTAVNNPEYFENLAKMIGSRSLNKLDQATWIVPYTLRDMPSSFRAEVIKRRNGQKNGDAPRNKTVEKGFAYFLPVSEKLKKEDLVKEASDIIQDRLKRMATYKEVLNLIGFS